MNNQINDFIFDNYNEKIDRYLLKFQSIIFLKSINMIF